MTLQSEAPTTKTAHVSADALAAADQSKTRKSRFGAVSLLIGLFVLGACSDAPMAPQQSIDRVAAANVAPSVTDARMRRVDGIENEVVRERVRHDLEQLEAALAGRDGHRARFHVKVVGNVLKDYRSQQAEIVTDGADVGAILLMLNAVSRVVGADFDMTSFQ